MTIDDIIDDVLKEYKAREVGAALFVGRIYELCVERGLALKDTKFSRNQIQVISAACGVDGAQRFRRVLLWPDSQKEYITLTELDEGTANVVSVCDRNGVARPYRAGCLGLKLYDEIRGLVRAKDVMPAPVNAEVAQMTPEARELRDAHIDKMWAIAKRIRAREPLEGLDEGIEELGSVNTSLTGFEFGERELSTKQGHGCRCVIL
jgi:hypothetical protein